MENSSFRPIGPESIRPTQSTPAHRPTSGTSAPGDPSFNDELSQILQENNPSELSSASQVLASDQRLNELRADLTQARQQVQKLQAFQAQAIQLYKQQADN